MNQGHLCMVGVHSAVVKDSTEIKLSIVTYHTYRQDPNIGHNTEVKTRLQIRVGNHKHTLNLCNHMIERLNHQDFLQRCYSRKSRKLKTIT